MLCYYYSIYQNGGFIMICYTIRKGVFGGYDVIKIEQARKYAKKYRNKVATFRKFQKAVDYARLLSVLNDVPLMKKFDFTEKEKRAIKDIAEMIPSFYCSVGMFLENVATCGVAEFVEKINAEMPYNEIINHYI